MTQRYKAILEYDGSGFVGWQVQPNGPSIQAEVEHAISVLNKGPVKVTAAGRTDAGVHAIGQVVSFDLSVWIEPRRLLHGFNALVDQRISMTRIEPAPADFDAQRMATSKLYRYAILNRDARSPRLAGRAWHRREPLDLGSMRSAAAHLVGEHDFAAFRAADSCAMTSVRKISDIAIEKDEDLLTIEFRSSGFLRHMVRNMVGTLVEVGSGRGTPEWVREVLASRDRTKAGPTAPAHGLCLVSVEYSSYHSANFSDEEEN